MQKIKVGVVGIGHLGRIHAKIYQETESCSLVAVCDINKTRLNQVSGDLNIPGFTDYRELFDKVEAVSIAVPTELHYKIAYGFLKHKIHTLIEKPFTTDLKEADLLIKLAKENKLILQVGHIERFNSAFAATQKLIQQPKFIECHRLSPFPNRSLDVGAVLDIMIHDIDIILGLVPSEIEKIESVGVNVLTQYEDIANARITFKNGCVANLTASRVSDEWMRRIRIFQKDTYISLDYKDAKASVYKKTGLSITKEDLPIEKEEPLQKELESFLDCVIKDKAPLVSGIAAREALGVALKIQNQIWNKKQKKHILIISGEPSGELHAANLIKAMLEINREIKFSGVGGEFMRNAGAQIICDIKDLAVIGLFDVLKKLPKFFALKNYILQKIKQEQPDAIILVDFSGFNLRLAKAINKTIPTIYYISPQIWASRSGRVNTIKKYIHKMIVFFKFEEEFYRKYGVDVNFIGHPLLDIVKPLMEKKEFLNKFCLSESKVTIAFLPGSRRQEIENILPIMLKTSIFISKKIGAQFVIVKSPQVNGDIYNRNIQRLNLNNIDLKVIQSNTYDCLKSADFCLIASGTATLETAIMQRPFAIIYKMNPFNYFLYRPQIKVPYIGMVNIVAKEKIVPEFIQFRATPKRIANEVLKILQNPSQLEQMKNDLKEVKSLLGQKGASLRAAKIILDFLKI